jgi:ABC-2 type transport system ATP-binding protein
MDMLNIKNFSKVYADGKIGARDINLEIVPGDCYAIIGHNGAGKTTIIKSIVGISSITSGEILVNGNSIAKEPIKCKQVIAYLPDDPALPEYLTGLQYVNFICNVYGVDASVRESRISEIGDLLEITNDMSNLISSYSHGMKQKIAILAALIHKPKLLIMDEPFVGLDPIVSFNLKILIKKHCDEGNAVFFSSHVLDVVEKLCNKVAIIKEGKILISGTTKSITRTKSLEKIFIELVKKHEGN